MLVSLLALTSAGTAFVLYKYTQLQNENLGLKESFEELQSSKKEIHETAEQIVSEDQLSASETKKVTVSIPTTAESLQLSHELIQKPEPDHEPIIGGTVEEVNTQSETIEIIHVGQTAFEDDYGGVYGAYGLDIKITAVDQEIMIPMTTTDSIGSGVIGLSYNTEGNPAFKGRQESKLKCAIMTNGFCKVKPGDDLTVELTVWLMPDSETSGNYALNFDEMKYFIDGEEKTFSIDRSTSKINIYY